MQFECRYHANNCCVARRMLDAVLCSTVMYHCTCNIPCLFGYNCIPRGSTRLQKQGIKLRRGSIWLELYVFCMVSFILFICWKGFPFFFSPYPGCGFFLATLIASPGMRYTQLRLPKFDSEVKDNSLWPLVVM